MSRGQALLVQAGPTRRIDHHSSTRMPKIKYNARMRHIGSHLSTSLRKTRETERGELMRYFCQKINVARIRDGLPAVSMGRMGKMFQKIPTKDLYYIKKVCDDSTNFSKKFWWLMNPKNHPTDKKVQ